MMKGLSAKSVQAGGFLPKTPWKLIFVALIFLFNPSVNVIDILPDFIGYFIIARLLVYPADVSPYFEEARSTFLKLAWLNVAKMLAIFLVFGNEVNRGDTTALFAFGFAVGDAILGIMAIRYLFEALFYLGQRTEVTAIIEPFQISRHHSTTPDAYRSLTIFLLIVKCAIATLPEFLLLTEDTINGGYGTANLSFYPVTVVLSQLLGWVIGFIWLKRSFRYAKALLRDNGLVRAFNQFFDEDYDFIFEKKFRLRALLASFTIMMVASFFMFIIRFDNLGGDMLVPSFLFPLIFIYAIFVGRKYFKHKKVLFVLGILSALSGIVESVLSSQFFDKHTLEDIYYFETAKALYAPLEVISIVSSALTVLLLLVALMDFRSFILENTGITPLSEGYRAVDRDYHKELSRRSLYFFGSAILLYILRAIDVFLYGNPKVIFTNPDDVTMPTLVTSYLPWFSPLVCGLSVVTVLLSLYFFSTLKDEVKTKYEIW